MLRAESSISGDGSAANSELTAAGGTAAAAALSSAASAISRTAKKPAIAASTATSTAATMRVRAEVSGAAVRQRRQGGSLRLGPRRRRQRVRRCGAEARAGLTGGPGDAGQRNVPAELTASPRAGGAAGYRAAVGGGPTGGCGRPCRLNDASAAAGVPLGRVQGVRPGAGRWTGGPGRRPGRVAACPGVGGGAGCRAGSAGTAAGPSGSTRSACLRRSPAVPSRGSRATAARLVPDGSSAMPRMIISARSIRIRRFGVLTSRPETTAPSRPECGCGGTGSFTTDVSVAIAVPWSNGGRPSTQANSRPPRLQASEIGPGRNTAGHLRGDVGGGAEQQPGGRHGLLGRAAGDAEIGELDPAVVADQHVRRA